MSLRHWAVLGGLSCAIVVMSGQSLARTVVPNPSGPTQNLSLTLPAPVNVRVTQSLASCRAYAGGGLAGIGCAAAMGNRWYILIWDWHGVSIDGYRVYQRPPSTLARDPFAGRTPIQTISQHAQVRVALLDPRQVGTNTCFTVTAYSGTIESPRSAQTCVSAASATNPIFKSVALVPTTSPFYGYHHERTHRHDCSSGSWPQFADGTLVWRGFYPVSVDWGMVMYEADWHAGTQPFPCPEFFTQVLRLGLVFPLPSDIATLQSATLVGTVQETNGNCSYALYSLASETIAVNPTQQLGGGTQPGGFAQAIPGPIGWQGTMWLYPASQQAIAGFWAWPPSQHLLQLNTDVTAVVRQHSDFAAFLLEPQDSITWTTGDAFGSPAGSSFVHQDLPLCQTVIRNIRLNLKYISKGGS